MYLNQGQLLHATILFAKLYPTWNMEAQFLILSFLNLGCRFSNIPYLTVPLIADPSLISPVCLILVDGVGDRSPSLHSSPPIGLHRLPAHEVSSEFRPEDQPMVR